MTIQAIKQSGNQKIIAIARRLWNKKYLSPIMCDWNTVPGKLRIFWSNENIEVVDFGGDFKEAVKYIWSIY